MRKAVIFTITTIVLFLPLILSGINLRLRFLEQSTLISQKIPSSISYNLFDDISLDIQNLLGIKTSNEINFTINDSLPMNVTQANENYLLFIDNVINNQYTTNINVSPIEDVIKIYDIGDYHYDKNKNHINITANASPINYYKINVISDAIRINIFDNWDWTTEGTYIVLNIIDSAGKDTKITGKKEGYVNPNITNWISLNHLGGVVGIIFGKHVLNGSLVINVTGININTSITLDRKARDVRTGYLISFNNSVLNLSKSDFTVIR